MPLALLPLADVPTSLTFKNFGAKTTHITGLGRMTAHSHREEIIWPRQIAASRRGAEPDSPMWKR